MYLAIAIITVATFIYAKTAKSRKKIFGVYSTAGKWYLLKYITMLTILHARRLKSMLKTNKNGFGYGTKRVEDLEKLQQMSGDEKAFDAVFYQGVNADGYYFVGGVERRQRAKVNGLVYLLVPGIGLLHSERLPKTELDVDPVALHKLHSFAGEGMSFTPIEPMKRWRISYNGKMWVESGTEKKWYNVKFEADYTSNFRHFVLDSDSDKAALARAIAKETWNKEFFESLEKAHQTHYEQMGFIAGTLTIDEKTHNIEMMAFRDHSFGYKRDWTLLHRYIFHMFYLDNGIRISCGVVSQPSTISHFEVGYVLHPNKAVHAIQSCDLQLYQHAEDGRPPNELGFSIVANDVIYDCKVNYVADSVHYKGGDHEAKLFERFFTCQVNGMRGRGVSEWQYNNVGTYKEENLLLS